jgi:hypothetical protein
VFVDASECNKTCVATDVFGGGYVYLMALEVRTLPECKTAAQPFKRMCSGRVCYEEGCVVTALYVKQADVTTSRIAMRCGPTLVGVQETYLSLDVSCGSTGESIRNIKLTSAQHNLPYGPPAERTWRQPCGTW